MYKLKIFSGTLLTFALVLSIYTSALAYNSLDVVNSSGQNITKLYFVSANSSTWGYSLGGLSNGYYRTFNLIPGISNYSLRVVYENGDVYRTDINTSIVWRITLTSSSGAHPN
ncbi:MAG: hypothetical protein IJ797_11425 [Selenomonadaceae bacterium]|nr:hypothetical protein [Selenomonadaceae bacterium]